METPQDIGLSFGRVLEAHKSMLNSINHDSVERFADSVVSVLRRGAKIMVCGNGGSAADAQHFAAELTVRFETERRGLPAMALTTDTSALTAAGNDFGYENVFSRLVETFGHDQDALICLSTSGASQNILKAQQVAARMGILTLAITGCKPNPLVSAADVSIMIPGNTARTQEGTILVLHYLAAAVDAAF